MNKKDKSEEINEMIPEEQEIQDLESDINRQPEEVKSAEEQLQEDLDKEKDKFLRLFAEFENYKKRTTKERMDLFKTAGQEVIVALLPIMDDFDRALKEISKSTEKELFKGVDLISNKFKETLKSKGLQEMKTKVGDTFDAEEHDAITQIPAPSKKLKGKIIDVVEKGYKLGDKIIRHPKVVVGN
ncbi:nucleotide exchange factor GrpE [Eudoraea sp.]|uniref:nucleotide exchange factor GrpE n=1 Tax=Eudoraea sp. TaxID=1979955 RepID=UPI003C7339DC